VTSQPGEQEQQPAPYLDGGDPDSPVAGPVDAGTTGATATGTIPVTGRPPEQADGSGLAAGSGKQWRPFPWRDRSARRSAVRPDGTGPAGPGGPANGPTTLTPNGNGAAGDPPQRTPADGSAQPPDTAAQVNGFQGGATTHDPGSTGQGGRPAPNPGEGPPPPRRPSAPVGGGAGRAPAPAGRQRRQSERATGDRAVAALEAAHLRRAVAAAAADLLWTRPPEKPTRYRLPARLSDMGHGWLDGRRGLPHLPEPAPSQPSGPTPPAGEAPVPPIRAHTAPAVPDAQAPPAAQESSAAGEPPTASVPTTQPSWLQTPRMRVLWGQALELIEAEEEACIRDCSAYLSQLSRFQKARDIAATRHEQALAELDLARRPLTESELLARRLAEQNKQDRPESLVRARRQIAWERRLAIAVQEVNTSTAQLADATREAELRSELHRNRIALAQAAAHRHYEFYLRRTATYLQQLVRTHERGRDLNMLLMRHQVGPQLPEWTRKPPNSDETSSQ